MRSRQTFYFSRVFILAVSVLLVSCASVLIAQSPSPSSSEPKATSSKSSSAQTHRSDNTEADVVRVDTDLVNTLFTAVDKDRHFVTSLRSEDVRILEDGVPQEITLFERETDRPLSIAILLDTSESQKQVLSAEKAAALAFIDSVIRPEKDRAAILSFTGATRIEQDLTSEVPRLRQAVSRVKFEISPANEERIRAGEPPLPVDEDPTGYTGVWDAVRITVKKILSNSSPSECRSSIILLTDGDDTSSKITREEALHLAVKSDVVVYAIGIRDDNFPYGKLDRGALRKISEHSGGRAFFPADETELRSAFAQIEQELRSQYAIAYSPKNKRRDGAYRAVNIEIVNPELRKRKLRLLYRQGYYSKQQQSDG